MTTTVLSLTTIPAEPAESVSCKANMVEADLDDSGEIWYEEIEDEANVEIEAGSYDEVTIEDSVDNFSASISSRYSQPMDEDMQSEKPSEESAALLLVLLDKRASRTSVSSLPVENIETVAPSNTNAEEDPDFDNQKTYGVASANVLYSPYYDDDDDDASDLTVSVSVRKFGLVKVDREDCDSYEEEIISEEGDFDLDDDADIFESERYDRTIHEIDEDDDISTCRDCRVPTSSKSLPVYSNSPPVEVAAEVSVKETIPEESRHSTGEIVEKSTRMARLQSEVENRVAASETRDVGTRTLSNEATDSTGKGTKTLRKKKKKKAKRVPAADKAEGQALPTDGAAIKPKKKKKKVGKATANGVSKKPISSKKKKTARKLDAKAELPTKKEEGDKSSESFRPMALLSLLSPTFGKKGSVLRGVNPSGGVGLVRRFLGVPSKGKGDDAAEENQDDATQRRAGLASIRQYKSMSSLFDRSSTQGKQEGLSMRWKKKTSFQQ